MDFDAFPHANTGDTVENMKYMNTIYIYIYEPLANLSEMAMEGERERERERIWKKNANGGLKMV